MLTLPGFFCLCEYDSDLVIKQKISLYNCFFEDKGDKSCSWHILHVVVAVCLLHFVVVVFFLSILLS